MLAILPCKHSSRYYSISINTPEAIVADLEDLVLDQVIAAKEFSINRYFSLLLF